MEPEFREFRKKGWFWSMIACSAIGSTSWALEIKGIILLFDGRELA